MKTVRQMNPLNETEVMRFWMWVKKTDSCWNWQGATNSHGYGRTKKLGGSENYAHRVSWMLANGPMPEGLVIDHKCHNTACVNPEHLQAVTHKENLENYLPVRNKTGYRGVRVHKSGKFYGEVKHNYKVYQTGLVDTVEQANEDVIAMRNRLFTNNLQDRVA